MKRACDVAGCDRAHEARGLCGLHYKRYLKRAAAGLPTDLEALRQPRRRTYTDGTGTCTAPGCSKPSRANNPLCPMHCSRISKWGVLEPLSLRRLVGTAIERFVRCIDPQPDGCWLWTRGLDTSGYGRFKVAGRQRGAHRWAYEHFVGSVPEGLELDHLCRVRHCVNPDHLEPVTHDENIRRIRATEGTSCVAS